MTTLVDPTVTGAVAVTPSDTDDLTMPSGTNRTKGLYIGGAGNISVIMADGETVTFTAIAIGVYHPISVKRVLSTDTTATLILALY